MIRLFTFLLRLRHEAQVEMTRENDGTESLGTSLLETMENLDISAHANSSLARQSREGEEGIKRAIAATR